MSTIRTLATVAIAGFIAAPLSAQTVQDRVEQARRRAESNQQTTVRDRIEQARRRAEGGVLSRTGSGGVLSRTDSRRGGSKVPPGHRPPAGMCRVWIDGVPPGHQPAVTDCTTARIEAARTPNSRVIYGDTESFPGKGKGKFNNRDRDRAGDNTGIFRDRGS
jgi:Ni/Co efflux regulator RcnB